MELGMIWGFLSFKFSYEPGDKLITCVEGVLSC